MLENIDRLLDVRGLFRSSTASVVRVIGTFNVELSVNRCRSRQFGNPERRMSEASKEKGGTQAG